MLRVLQIAESASAVGWSFLSMPKDPLGKPRMLQVGLSMPNIKIVCASLCLKKKACQTSYRELVDSTCIWQPLCLPAA